MKKRIRYTNEPVKATVIKDFVPPPSELRFRQAAVRVTYDTQTDTLRMTLRESLVSESSEVVPGIVVDYDKDGNMVGVEVLEASKRAINPKALEFAVA